MAKQNLGMVTAYAYAVAGGYTGTEAEFEALLGNIATDLEEIENLTVTATTLPEGSSATASYSDGVLTLGIPKGDTGATGAGATVSVGTTTTGDPGTDASVTNSGTAKDAVFNFTIPRGDTGNGIESITLTSTVGAVHTYTITFTDGDTTTFEVTDGEVTTAALTAILADYATRDEVTDLKSDFEALNNALFNYENASVEVTSISGIVKKAGYSGSGNSTELTLSQNASYDSYYFFPDKTYSLYFDENIPANKYVAIIHGIGYTSEEAHSTYIDYKCSGGATRYRNSQNNLPTEQAPLVVNSGDIVAFTFLANDTYPVCGYGLIKIKNYETAESGTYTKTENELQITTNKARYIFKRITNNSINVDTWRLYSGELKRLNGTLFEMWSGSDAEGVVQISGEDDFIGGYHGDEIMTNIRIFADGVDITSESNKTDKFDVISIYVESDVYHCNTSDLASTVAFKRNKWLKFEREKVRIGNEWTAQSALSIASAPLALFQCYYKEGNTEVATDYMANSDYKLYQMSTPATHTPNSKDNTEFTLETKINPIRFKSIKTNGASPMGVVAYTFISAQNRVKFYYYTIYSTTAIANGDKLISEFEFEVM